MRQYFSTALLLFGLASAASAQVTFQDDFTTFNMSNWATAPYMNGLYTTTYQGLPQTLTPTVLDGNTVVRSTSVMTNLQRRGFGTVNSFSAPEGSMRVDFKTMPFNDPSIPAANQQNIDELLGITLINPTDGRNIHMAVNGGFYGNPATRFYIVGSSFGGGIQTAVGWSYNTYYRFGLESAGGTTRLSLRDTADVEILGHTFNFELEALGPYHIVLSQSMGQPNGEYYADVALDRIVFTGVPEPSSLALCGLGAASLIWRVRRSRRS